MSRGVSVFYLCLVIKVMKDSGRGGWRRGKGSFRSRVLFLNAVYSEVYRRVVWIGDFFLREVVWVRVFYFFRFREFDCFLR